MKNIILFTIDTLRRDVFGVYGNEEGLTPFVDSIRDKLMIFDNCFAVGPYTQASFPGILTSGYFFDQTRDPQPVLSPRRKLISEALKMKKIQTAGFHSNPYMSDFFGWKRGWNAFYDGLVGDVDVKYPYMRSFVINEKVKNFLDSYIGEDDYDPFFVWMHYMDVHEPYVPGKEDVMQVCPELEHMTSDDMYQMFLDVVLPRDVSDPEKVATLHKLYKAQVYEVDRGIKELFDILEEFDILDETIVIFTSDHGDEFNDHGGLSHDGKFYNELVNVPFMIYDSDRTKEERVKTVISNIDIPPTILHHFGYENDPKFKGQSIFPLEDYDAKGAWGEAIGKVQHQILPTDKPAFYYTDGKYKIMYYEEENRYYFYDLENDPKELNNLTAEHAEFAKYLDLLKPFAERTFNYEKK